ncbi:MAG TPA: hypothetical protein VM638_00215 [Actinomycetota bacterium]|nr:hypothetical protein [Actinomycetota bacterium]
MIATAYLRVFRPLAVMPEGERSHWEAYIAAGEHERPARPRYRHGWTHGRLGIITSEEEGRADVRLIDGEWYVCPWRTRIRTLASLLSLRETIPREVADELVPEVEARRAARELARIRRRDPAAIPTLLQSAWHVPVRWFVLVADEERRIVPRGPDRYRLSYWTTLPEARTRTMRALEVLRRSELDVVADLVEDMASWLSVFPDRAAVELDYDRVSDLFGPLELDEDHSARDLHASLDALEAGDPDRAGAMYERVAMRWAEAKTRESLN